MTPRRILALIAACAALAACAGEPHRDLRQFVKDAEAMPHGQLPPLPEVKPHEPFLYTAADLIDPFKPRKIEPPRGPGSGIAPDVNRPREPLEAYPLESLRMVGTLAQKKQVHALVKTPDNSLYRVRIGNYLGQNFGRIIAIDESAIRLREILQDSTGNWEEKEQMLMLQEEQEAKQ
jgi:type IV pilus assembly protein PilP